MDTNLQLNIETDKNSQHKIIHLKLPIVACRHRRMCFELFECNPNLFFAFFKTKLLFHETFPQGLILHA